MRRRRQPWGNWLALAVVAHCREFAMAQNRPPDGFAFTGEGGYGYDDEPQGRLFTCVDADRNAACPSWADLDFCDLDSPHRLYMEVRDET